MKSCLGILLTLSVLIVFIGGGALIYYLSNNAEFSRRDGADTAPPPVTRGQ